MLTMPRPVDVLIGDTNRPSALRSPMVTARISAAEMTRIQYFRLALMRVFLTEWGAQRARARSCGAVRNPQSTLAPEALTILPHLAISPRILLAICSGVELSTS